MSASTRSTRTWYNENDPQIVAWLRELRAEGLIPDGMIDERSIEDIRPSDCAPTSHFFSGIAGWAYALQLAGWPADAPVWTGSPPCQPFSTAGKGGGFADPRHLWPVWKNLIAECRPPVCFGEQVASPAGREWLARVRADLEAMGYAVGPVDLCAASIGAPQMRQRLFWVACAEGERYDGRDASQKKAGRAVTQNGGAAGGLAHPKGPAPRTGHDLRKGQSDAGTNGGHGCWSEFEIIEFSDGKRRRIESGTFPLAPRIPSSMGRLRGYGNSIVPQLAAVFVRAYMEARGLV